MYIKDMLKKHNEVRPEVEMNIDSPYHALVSAIILNAFEENDIEWLKSRDCEVFCGHIGLPHKYVVKVCNSTPEERADIFKICPKCNQQMICFTQLFYEGKSNRRICVECKKKTQAAISKRYWKTYKDPRTSHNGGASSH